MNFTDVYEEKQMQAAVLNEDLQVQMRYVPDNSIRHRVRRIGIEKILLFVCVFLQILAIVLYATDPFKSSSLERENALNLLKTAEVLISKTNISAPSWGQFKPTDCSEILANGSKKSGLYTIWPKERYASLTPLLVYCDMKTDSGGWTVIQRRGKFTVQQNFYQDWEAYKNGFGNVTQEFWLGNENIQVLCRSRCELRFELQDKDGLDGFAVYKNFYLLGSSYTLYASDYYGDIGDGMQHHNLRDFATKDHGKMHKADEHLGGWWYGDGNWCNLNGLQQFGETNRQTVHWWDWRNYTNLAHVEIKVRPN